VETGLQVDAQQVAATHRGLGMVGVTKRFGGLQALNRVSIAVAPGQVLALCGANGAGKSTLIRILAGAEHADEGRVLLDGEEVRIDSPLTASALGLSFVHQELNLVPKFTGLQNMAMGAGRSGRLGFLNLRGLRARAHAVGDQLGYQVNLDTPVEELSVSDRWMVSLGRSLMTPARFVAMDEPTASFTDEEAERLFRVIDQLTSSGVGILYVSHRLEEVLRVSDEVTVLRNGTLVASYQASELDVPSLTKHIVGHEVRALTLQSVLPQDGRHSIRLQAKALARRPAVVGATFDVAVGEILGVAGLVGSGRTELARLLIGADRATEGQMVLDGRPYAPRSPHQAIRAGVALVPEERRSQGLIVTESVESNLAMAAHGASRWLLTLHRPRSSRRTAEALVKRLGVKTAGVRVPMHSLSGGNQQKVVVGKYLRTGPSLLILDEPTVGVDVGAREELYDIIKSLAQEGTSVIVISSDFEELAVCHRVLVMRHGSVVAEVPGDQATKNRLTELCFGHDDHPMEAS